MDGVVEYAGKEWISGAAGLVLSYKMPVWSSRKTKLYLAPISETEASTLGIGRNSGETMRIVNTDKEEGLYFWGFKMKKKPS